MILVILTAGLACFWLRETGRYDCAWLIAVIPAPGVWFVLAQATYLAYSWGNFATSFIVGLLSAMWIALMIVTVLQMSRRELPVEEIDFAIGLAGWSNCLAIGLVALTI
jgi:hypothetical protein